MADKKLSLYGKMNKIMADIKYLAKDGKVSFGTTNYKVLSEAKVTQVVKEKLVELGLVIFPIKQDITRTGNLTTVNTQYKIVDVESGDSEILASSGEGADTQDKGAGKAMTYCYKYMLLRTFAIPSGEDPDQISSEELTETIEKEKKVELTFSDEQKNKMKKLKETFHLKDNTGLNKYVKHWAKHASVTASTWKDITPANVDEFCAFTQEQGNEVVPFGE